MTATSAYRFPLDAFGALYTRPLDDRPWAAADGRWSIGPDDRLYGPSGEDRGRVLSFEVPEGEPMYWRDGGVPRLLEPRYGDVEVVVEVPS